MKKRLIIGFAVLFVICSLFAIFFLCSGKRPYKSLCSADIASATVSLYPPDKTIQITDIDELVELLNDVVVYRKDNSYREYAGQAVVFNLDMYDGSQLEITAYNPFVVINGTGYITKYEPCEKLNSYANELLYRSQ